MEKSPSFQGPALLLLMIALFIQIISATFFVANSSSPNPSAGIAKNIVEKKSYEIFYANRLMQSLRDSRTWFYFHLPGEPLFLSLCFRFFPSRALPYVHIPIVLTLILSIATVGFLSGGRNVGFVSGLLASLHPFIVLHGPVLDDTFLAAALIWVVLTILLFWFQAKRKNRIVSKFNSVLLYVVLFFVAGYASITRAESRLIFFGWAALSFIVPVMKEIRKPMIVVLLGMALSMGLWSTRNFLQVGEFTSSFSSFGITFWESNNAMTLESLKHGQVEQGPYDLPSLTEFPAGTSHLTEEQVSSYFFKKTLSRLFHRPISSLKIGLIKCIITGLGIRPELPIAHLRNQVAIWTNLIVFILAIYGWRLSKRIMDRATHGFLSAIFSLLFVVTLMILMLGPIGLRYRIFFEGVLAIFAAFAVVVICRRAVGRGELNFF